MAKQAGGGERRGEREAEKEECWDRSRLGGIGKGENENIHLLNDWH